MGKMFKKGFDVSREEKAKQEARKEASGKKLFEFFLSKDGDEADVVFLTSEPINFQKHTVQETVNGKVRYRSYTCTQDDDCPFCADGQNSTYCGAFLIWDKRPYEYTDKGGNKKKNTKGSIRMYTPGIRVVSQLDRLNTKYGIANRNITIVRIGTGTSTTYTLERGDKEKITTEQIKELLPEKLRDSFDGTEDSLYNIVGEQVEMGVKNYNPSNSDSDEDETEDKDYDTGVMGMDDEEEEKLKKKGLFKKTKPQNSAKKSLFRDR